MTFASPVFRFILCSGGAFTIQPVKSTSLSLRYAELFGMPVPEINNIFSFFQI